MSLLLRFWRLLDRQQRRRLVGLQLLSVVMGLSSVGGVAAVLPFFTALADPSAIRRSAVLRGLIQHFPLDNDNSLVILLGAGFSASVNAGYKSSYVANSFIEPAPRTIPSYCRLDARVGFSPSPNVELFVSGQNLLQDYHREWADGLEIPRSFYGGISAKF